jgi:hypothetical protein
LRKSLEGSNITFDKIPKNCAGNVSKEYPISFEKTLQKISLKNVLVKLPLDKIFLESEDDTPSIGV